MVTRHEVLFHAYLPRACRLCPSLHHRAPQQRALIPDGVAVKWVERNTFDRLIKGILRLINPNYIKIKSAVYTNDI